MEQLSVRLFIERLRIKCTEDHVVYGTPETNRRLRRRSRFCVKQQLASIALTRDCLFEDSRVTLQSSEFSFFGFLNDLNNI